MFGLLAGNRLIYFVASEPPPSRTINIAKGGKGERLSILFDYFLNLQYPCASSFLQEKAQRLASGMLDHRYADHICRDYARPTPPPLQGTGVAIRHHRTQLFPHAHAKAQLRGECLNGVAHQIKGKGKKQLWRSGYNLSC